MLAAQTRHKSCSVAPLWKICPNTAQNMPIHMQEASKASEAGSGVFRRSAARESPVQSRKPPVARENFTTSASLCQFQAKKQIAAARQRAVPAASSRRPVHAAGESESAKRDVSDIPSPQRMLYTGIFPLDFHGCNTSFTASISGFRRESRRESEFSPHVP